MHERALAQHRQWNAARQLLARGERSPRALLNSAAQHRHGVLDHSGVVCRAHSGTRANDRDSARANLSDGD